MTQDTTNLGVEVSDGGTSKETQKRILDLKEVIKATSQAARDARKELKAMEGESGGTAGSRKIANDISNYSKQRGVAALTGASGRDFANQAQGLDGIVRLYATYAANVFALGAAFRGLGQAIDTQNMVKGLDQLGASVGRNLGGLSKRVSELTGGAISMREAMQAVALTSSGGISEKNIERLAGVARSASLALGVAMPDAISRLSRGITKLEPELLDELGIMTRLEPATQAYARELGKTVTQLTDFERRQAFANAVLAEGEAKFGAITNLETNPYDKLVSSLKNLAQEGAEVVNKVLAPLANFLSQSPALLGGGVLALLSSVIKRAIPEIGEFKSQLSDAVNKAAEFAKVRAKEANEAELRMTRVAKQQAEERADIQIAAVARAEEAVKNLQNNSIKSLKTANSVLNKLTATGKVDEFDLRALEATAKRREHANKPEEAKAYREVAKAVKEYAAAHEAAVIQIEREQQAIVKQQQASKTSIAGLTRALAIAAEEEAIKKSIVSNAAYNASLIGIAKASVIMKEEIASSTLTLSLWGRTVLQAQGYAAMFAGVLSTIGNAVTKLTGIVAWVGTIISLFSILDTVFAGSRKELERFNKASDNVNSSIENINRTVTQLERSMTSGTINGITSMGNAIDDLNNNVIELIDSFQKARKELSSNAWNLAINGIADIFGGGVQKNFEKDLVSGIKGALSILANSPLKGEAERTFKDILEINTLDIESINTAVSKLSNVGIAKLQEAISNFSKESSNSSSRVQNFRQALDASTRAYQQFIQSTSNTSPLFRVGSALQNLGVSMFQTSQEIKLGINEINAAINHISEVPEAGVIFGNHFIEDLVSIREEFMGQNKAISAYRKSINELDKEITNSKFAKFKSISPENLSKEAIAGLEKLKQLTKDKEEIEKGVTLLSEQQSEKARRLFNDGLNAAFTRGSELIRVSLGQAMERGAIAIGKAALAGLTGAQKAEAENALVKQELDIQLRAIKTNVDVILSQALLRASLDKNTAAANLASARQAGKTDQEIKTLESVQEASDIFYNIIKDGQTPNFSNISKLTSNPDVIDRVRVSGIADSQRLAEQNEAKVLLDAQRQALGISGAINIRSGQLEDTQKLISLQQQVIQNDSQRVNIINNLVGLTSEVTAKAQAEADRNNLLLKQRSELLAIDTAIANAGGNDAEVRKQEEFRLLVLSRHERELDLQLLTSSQRVIQASVEMLVRQLELTKAINDNNYRMGIAQVDILNAENSAFNSLFGASAGFSAIQNEIVGSQRSQLDFVKAISEAQIALTEKEIKAKKDLAALDPIRDQASIKTINDELERQVGLTDITISNAKIQLETQQKILSVNKAAALQQDRYNRILNNSTKAADSMAKAFGTFGTALGTIAEAFANMTVSSNKNAGELARIRKQQEGLSKDSVEYAQLEEQYSIQRNQYAQDQIGNYASIAGAAKNLFDEQSSGYKILMAIEKAMYIAHIAMAIKQIAVDTLSAKTSIALDVAEAETSGVLAVVKTIAGLPPPFNFIAGIAMAGLITTLLASIGGSGPSVSGSVPMGSKAEDAQAVQGTGRGYINGKLSDVSGGALGSSTEKVNDIANSLELIQNNTSLSSSFALKTIDTLKQIEKNTKDLAAEAFKSTNIGKLTSGFGTIEKSLPATSGGLLSSLIPSTSKSVEIIDKGISVIGKFSEILSGTAKLLEFETVQTTKTKSGFLGIGGKTKVKVNTNTKDLSQQAEETVVDLFSNLAFAAISASKQVLGSANDQIEKILQDFTISFKVSGLGLTGEEFANAILAESSVVLNQIIEDALPQFNEFRKLGEGFTSTLLRMATTVDVVSSKINLLFNVDVKDVINKNFKLNPDIFKSITTAANSYTDILNTTIQNSLKTGSIEITKLVPNLFGNIISTKEISRKDFKPSEDQIAQLVSAEQTLADTRNQIVRDLGLSDSKMISDLNAIQSTYTKASLAILDNVNAQKDFETVNKLISGQLQLSDNARLNSQQGINDEVKNLYLISLDLAKATEKVNKAFSDQNFITLTLYNSLVETLGGLDAFTEKTNFFFENFFSGAEQIASKTRQVNEGLKNFADAGIITADQLATLTDGVGNLRMEFRAVAESQNLFTDSGRKAYNTLLSFAPAIADISEAIPDSLSNVKKSIQELLQEFNLDSGTFADIFSRALLGDEKVQELGAEIASTIKQGYLKAISSSFIDTISNAFVNNIIAPILNSTLSWTTTDYMTATGNFTDFIGNLTKNAIGLSNMLSNPIFNEAINQATTVATTAITKLATTIRNTDNIFSDSKLLGYTSELTDLQKEFNTTTLQDAVDAEQQRLDLLQEQADTIKSAVEDLKDFNNRMKDFKDSLLIGPQSPLTPIDQYATAKSQLEQAFQTAASGASEEERKSARDKIEELSKSFLEVSRSVYSSGAQYTSDFDFVQSILDSLITDSGAQLSNAEQQLAALNVQIENSKTSIKLLQDQLKLLDSNNTHLQEVATRIAELTDLIGKERQKGIDAVANSFTLIDTNFNKLLTVDELKASGIASDETIQKYLQMADANGDGQISRLEAISLASTNTYYTLQSIIPIFESVKTGIISMDKAVQIIADMNQANISHGGTPINGSYNSGDGSGISVGTGFTPKFTSELGGYIQDNIVYGLNGKSIGLSQASNALLQMISDTANGKITAKQVYNTLLDWGVNSSLVATILGTTKTEVLNWFKFYDSSIPSFAQGINAVPEDMLAQIHKDERIMPAADNRLLLQSLSNRNDTNLELINEMKELNQKIERLEVAIQLGSAINAEATQRNTEEISKAVSDTASKNDHNNVIQGKVSLR